MAKKDLSGGMANLFSGADKNVVKDTQAGGSPDGGTQKGRQIGPTPEERALIDTIEDEKLRADLKERLRVKRLIGRGRPRKNDQLGRRPDGWERTSLIINKEKWEKIKEIAFRETLTLKEIIDLALGGVIERYEAKHGEIIPAKERDLNDIF